MTTKGSFVLNCISLASLPSEHSIFYMYTLSPIAFQLIQSSISIDPSDLNFIFRFVPMLKKVCKNYTILKWTVIVKWVLICSHNALKWNEKGEKSVS